MGFPLDLFVSEVDENLTCPICQDVLETPLTLALCGHTFCKSCLERCDVKTCPTCRQVGNATHPAFCLQGLIENLHIRCRNNDINSEEDGRKLDDDSAPVVEPVEFSNNNNNDNDEKKQPRCPWVGKLSAWPYHASHECCVRTLHCEIEGCDFVGSAKALEEHNVACTNKHLKLMLAAEMKRVEMKRQQQLEEKIKEQLASFERELHRQRTYFEDLITQEREQVVHLYLSSFCRRWMQSKPKFLSGFDIYHEKKCSYLQRLLCLVPGPKGSRWKDCKFPFMLEWTSVHRPPICRLPQLLRHYFASPTLPTFHLTGSDLWEPAIGIPELLLSIQHFLGRADVLALSEALHRHNQALAQEAQSLLEKYKHSHFLQNAETSFGIHSRDWQAVGTNLGEMDGIVRKLAACGCE